MVIHGTYELKFNLHKTCTLRPGCPQGKLQSVLFESATKGFFLKLLEQLLTTEDKPGVF